MRLLLTIVLPLAIVACREPADLMDLDGDDVVLADDCDDGNVAIFPNATELCDGIDNDCDGVVDNGVRSEFFADVDGDGFGDGSAGVFACTKPDGHVVDSSDCNDQDAAYNPMAAEGECTDPNDYNCDGMVDFADVDGDGVAACLDCDDNDAGVYPEAVESCDGKDNDCDGVADEPGSTGESVWYRDGDSDGWGHPAVTRTRCTAPTGFVGNSDDCNDSSVDHSPAVPEACDGQDHNCDGLIDNDSDTDGFSSTACGGLDCDDADSQIVPDPAGGCALGIDCAGIYAAGKSVGDQVYSVDPDGYDSGEPPVDVYCDMTTDGGGWTLVYAWTFEDYGDFRAASNAVTPRPGWQSFESDTPVSTTTPLAPDDYNAMDFSDWSAFGNDFLVTSTINHWVSCRDDGGSLVEERSGSVFCVNVQNVPSTCLGGVPDQYVHGGGAGGHGPQLRADRLYYYWEASTSEHWPTHDPCGDNQANHQTGVGSPMGNLFLRRP